MAIVNPPPYLKMPKKLFDDKPSRKYFGGLEFILFQMWKRTGAGTDDVALANQFNTTNQAALTAINERLGSGDALTSDETGFTVDSTALSVDMDEA